MSEVNFWYDYKKFKFGWKFVGWTGSEERSEWNFKTPVLEPNLYTRVKSNQVKLKEPHLCLSPWRKEPQKKKTVRNSSKFARNYTVAYVASGRACSKWPIATDSALSVAMCPENSPDSLIIVRISVRLFIK